MSFWILNANFWSIITCLKLTSSSQLSPSFIFSWTTIASISAYFKSIVSYCCSHEKETWKPYHWIMRGCTYNTCVSIILKLKGHNYTLSNDGLHVCQALQLIYQAVFKIILLFILLKWTEMFTRLLTRVPQKKDWKYYEVKLHFKSVCFPQITAKHWDRPVFTTFLATKASS